MRGCVAANEHGCGSRCIVVRTFDNEPHLGSYIADTYWFTVDAFAFAGVANLSPRFKTVGIFFSGSDQADPSSQLVR
jgi:hypothetical protein